LSIEEARKRAAAHDAKTAEEVAERRRGSARDMVSEVRAYLLRRSEEIRTPNNPVKLLRSLPPERNGVALVELGPTIDKGATPEHFHFDSGARLSFCFSLRERGHETELLAFRIHYQLPEGRSPEYLRFDLNQEPHEDPLLEPRCHLHPGMSDVRIPLALYDPIAILDRIFFVLERRN
jgi:hypothetical protein